LMMVSERCQMERGGAAVISSIDVGVSIKEEPHLDQPSLSSSINESLIKISLRSHGRDDTHRPTEMDSSITEEEHLPERHSSSERGTRAMARSMHFQSIPDSKRLDSLLVMWLVGLYHSVMASK